jgi:putative proteasome-type protease
MTFCLGMNVEGGLVGIADTRVTMGTECITARKVTVYQEERHSMFLMTSGLRSVRDKVLTYFDELMAGAGTPFDKLFKAVNALAGQIRRVAEEDKEALEDSGLPYNIHCLAGGQLENDRGHKLYLIYPQGNWVEIGQGTPYHIIGASGYGKPVLDRTLKHSDSMRFALKVGCLAFDSTRISAADVDFPLDVVLYPRDSFRIIERRYEKGDLAEMTGWWQERLRQSVNELPAAWIEKLFSGLAATTGDIVNLYRRAEDQA